MTLDRFLTKLDSLIRAQDIEPFNIYVKDGKMILEKNGKEVDIENSSWEMLF